MSNNLDAALEVLQRAKKEIIIELVRSGQNGGTGRALNQAPILNSLQRSIEIVQDMIKEDDGVAQRMAAVRAAKQANQQSK